MLSAVPRPLSDENYSELLNAAGLHLAFFVVNFFSFCCIKCVNLCAFGKVLRAAVQKPITFAGPLASLLAIFSLTSLY
jgi:hypothetical protein